MPKVKKRVVKVPVPKKKVRQAVVPTHAPGAVMAMGPIEKRPGAREEKIDFVVSYGCFSNDAEVAGRKERIRSQGWPVLTSHYDLDKTTMTCLFGGPFVNPREADRATGLFEEKGCMQIPKIPLQVP